MTPDSPPPEPGRRVSPLAAVVLAAIVVLPLVLLSVIIMRYMEFRAAMEGTAGTQGVAVVEQRVTGEGDDICTGTFTPADGGPPLEVDIDVKGICSEGERVPAVIVGPTLLHPDWGGRPTAWGEGTGTGEHLAPAIPVILFLIVPVWCVAWIFRRQLLRSLKRTRPGRG
jgi:hypothetical protein